MDDPYVRLTKEFNDGRLRAILASKQAVVLHRLAFMSKGGDWILSEDPEALGHVLGTLQRHVARYRYGAPLDLRWLTQGWSSHLEFPDAGARLRCDFVTRPPRVSPRDLQTLWQAPVRIRETPIVSLPILAELKKTNREKDYAVIGELARRMGGDRRLELLYSRSARDLIQLAEEQGAALAKVAVERPLLSRIGRGRQEIEVERLLDEERQDLIRQNQERCERYRNAARAWRREWPRLSKDLAGRPFHKAHQLMVARAAELLPQEP